MECDMCGSSKDLVRARIERAEMVVCEKCARFGKIVGPAVKKIEKDEIKRTAGISVVSVPEVIEMVADNFSEKIRRKRESMGLNQEDFGKKINEKESVVHKMETGELRPSIEIARKLERILGISLVEEYAEDFGKIAETKTENFTIGDIIKIRKRR